MGNITLILGGARSGKSAHAERLAGLSQRAKLYVATAQALDPEMEERVALHRQRRGAGWQTLEVPVAITEPLAAADYSNHIILLDCLTLWLSNVMHQKLDIEAQALRLVDALRRTQADVLLVSNEVGQGIVPDNVMARQFRDHAGMLHQRVAAVADRVIWMVAGIPTIIKGM